MSFGLGIDVRQLKQGRTKQATSIGVRESTYESCEERRSQTESLDPSKTKDNRYFFMGYEVEPLKGKEVSEWFISERDKKSEERVAQGKRKIRKDTSIGLSLVIYPEKEMTESMTFQEIEALRMNIFKGLELFLGHEPEIVIEHNDEGFSDKGERLGGVHWHVYDRYRDENDDYEFHKRCGRAALRGLHQDLINFLQGKIPNLSGEYSSVNYDIESHKEGGDPTKVHGVSANVRGAILDQQKGLAEKEKALAAEEKTLKAERAELDKQVQALETEKTNLQNVMDDFELERKSHAKQVEDDKADIEDKKQALEDEREAFEDKVDETNRQQEARELAIKRRRKRLKEEQDDLKSKQDDLKQAQARLATDTTSLVERERSVQAKEDSFTQRETDVSERETSVSVRETDVSERETDVSAREQAVTKREDEVSRKEELLDRFFRIADTAINTVKTICKVISQKAYQALTKLEREIRAIANDSLDTMVAIELEDTHYKDDISDLRQRIEDKERRDSIMAQLGLDEGYEK